MSNWKDFALTFLLLVVVIEKKWLRNDLSKSFGNFEETEFT